MIKVKTSRLIKVFESRMDILLLFSPRSKLRWQRRDNAAFSSRYENQSFWTVSLYSERHCSHRGQGRLSGRTMKRRESMTGEPFARSLFSFFLTHRPFLPPPLSASRRALCTLHSPVSATGRYTVPTFYALHAASSRFFNVLSRLKFIPPYSHGEKLSRNLPLVHAHTHTHGTEMAVQTR